MLLIQPLNMLFPKLIPFQLFDRIKKMVSIWMLKFFKASGLEEKRNHPKAIIIISTKEMDFKVDKSNVFPNILFLRTTGFAVRDYSPQTFTFRDKLPRKSSSLPDRSNSFIIISCTLASPHLISTYDGLPRHRSRCDVYRHVFFLQTCNMCTDENLLGIPSCGDSVRIK